MHFSPRHPLQYNQGDKHWPPTAGIDLTSPPAQCCTQQTARCIHFDPKYLAKNNEGERIGLSAIYYLTSSTVL
eukprot:1148295-Pelagomonas_calceolata.AAC.5